MFYFVGKVLTGLLQPSNLIALVLVVGTVLVLTTRGLVWGRRLLVTGVVLLLVCGYSPLGNLLVLPLEQRFSRGELPPDIAGIIVLGGLEETRISSARRDLSLNEAAERLSEALIVAHRRPQARLIFSGGGGTLLQEGSSAASAVGKYFVAAGIDPGRILLEPDSRTTFENAAGLKALLAPTPAQRFLLVTSAYHMPRAVGTFRRAGFDVLAWPVDYRTTGISAIWEHFTTADDGLRLVNLSVKEWMGLVAYCLSGRTTSMWPGPQMGAGNAIACH